MALAMILLWTSPMPIGRTPGHLLVKRNQYPVCDKGTEMVRLSVFQCREKRSLDD